MIGQRHRPHWAIEFGTLPETIDAAGPEDLNVHLVLDNYTIHETALIERWLAKRPRYHPQFTPEGASWLVECWFASPTAEQLRHGVHRRASELETAIDLMAHRVQRSAEAFIGTKTADEILASVASSAIESRIRDASFPRPRNTLRFERVAGPRAIRIA